MNIKIKGVRDAGDENQERVVLEVLADDDIGQYLVCDSTFTKDKVVSNKLRHVYWFPDKAVKKNDLVVLYTKPGRRTEKTNSDGSTTHFFYWNLESTVWNQDGDCAVLFEARNWHAKRT